MSDPLAGMTIAQFLDKTEQMEIAHSAQRWERARGIAVVVIECADGTNSSCNGIFFDQMAAAVYAQEQLDFLNAPEGLAPGDLPYIAKVLPLEPPD